MAWDQVRRATIGAPFIELLCLSAMAIGAGCTTATTESVSAGKEAPRSAAQVVPVAEEPSRQAAAATPAQEPSTPRSAPRAPEQIYYDLALHRDHAEIFQGETRVVDFGAAGDAKYTLGGWGTRVRGSAEVDGVSAALVRGAYGDIVLPVHFKGDATVELSLRVPRDGEVTAYLDQAVVARLKTDRTRFNTVRIELPAEKATQGEHLLRLRASGLAPMGRESAAIAIDWMSISPSSATPPAVVAKPVSGAVDELAIAKTQTYGFAFSVPQGGRFLTDVVAEPSARFHVTARFDAGESLALGEFGPGKVEIDLGAHQGKVLRLDLTAQADLTLKQPRVVTPQREAPRRLEKPVRNVLVYLIDTLRADHLTSFNSKTRVRTPGLDQLVASGSGVFTAAHTQENWTKPSVATLLSSLMPWEHHATTTEAVVPAAVELLPELLQGRGFHTGAFIANGYVSDKFGFKQGFDTFRNYIREGRYSRAEFLAADVTSWLDKRPEKLPFFLYVHAIDPHVPYKPTAEFLSLYDPSPYKGVVDFSNDTALLEKIKIGSIKLNERDKVRLEALYDSEISYHDVHFRAILTALEKRGLADDTMVVVVADHGEEFWDHGSVGHGHSVYEELLRIPMVVRVPGLTHGPATITSSAGLVDVMPTVLEALGETVPAGLSGRSLIPELSGLGVSAPQVTVSGFMDGWRTAVIANLKIIQRTERRIMLHDLADDPGEQTDVVLERPITTRYMRGQLGLQLAKTTAGQTAQKGKKVVREQKTDIDAETEAQLRALGYVGSSRR